MDSGDFVPDVLAVVAVRGEVVVVDDDDGSEEAEQGRNRTLSRRQGKKGRK